MEINIHNTIDSILNVANNEIKHKAKVIKDYGQLPLIYCNSIQLGQVFMNLLVNTAQAINNYGTLTIKTRYDRDNIIIDITDTGEGIPKDIQSKIFDPFLPPKKQVKALD